jgi:predicted O-methyltransferase YrrM
VASRDPSDALRNWWRNSQKIVQRARLLRYAAAWHREPPPSVAEVCEIKSLRHFEAGYAQLASMLGARANAPPAGQIEFLRSVSERPAYKGTIGPADYLFLTAFVSILAPRRVVEIGTLTGFSAGVIAAAIACQHGREGARVDTIDIHSQCAIDSTRLTGFELSEFFADLAPMIRLHTPGDSTVVARIAARDELELAFLDADHQHPLPLLDLLRLAPYMRQQSWVLLHDIRLGTLTRAALDAGQTTAFQPVYGAEWLFNQWPWRKISGGNIGAVQLPEHKRALVPFALRMMSIQFEIPEKRARAPRRALYQTIGQLA